VYRSITIRVYIHIFVSIYICIYVHVYLCIYVYIDICTYIHVYINLYTCAYVYVYVYVHRLTYTYIYMKYVIDINLSHTQIHPHLPTNTDKTYAHTQASIREHPHKYTHTRKIMNTHIQTNIAGVSVDNLRCCV